MAGDEEIRRFAYVLIGLGMTREDSATAVHLARLIRDVDRELFPSQPAVVECLPRAHRDGFVAGYDDTSSNPERYLVFTEGIYREFRTDCLGTRFVRGYGPGTKFPSLLERLKAVAVHEARHRYQRVEGVRLKRWSPSTKRSGLLGAVIKKVREEQSGRILQARVQKRWAVVEARLKEFDALVVEHFALHHIHATAEPSDIARFVRLEP